MSEVVSLENGNLLALSSAYDGRRLERSLYLRSSSLDSRYEKFDGIETNRNWTPPAPFTT